MILLQHIISIHPLITLTAFTTSAQAASLFHFKNKHIPDIFHCNTPFHRKFRNGRDGSKSNQLHYSLLLQSHRQWYGNSPPHDRELYDVLDVRPNATLAEISRSYKTLSREFHPDKVAWRRKRRQRRRKMMEEEGEVPLQEVEGCVATRSETGSGIETNVNVKEIRSNDIVDADFTTNGNPVIEFRQETPSGNDTNNCTKLNPVPTTSQSHFIPPPPPPPPPLRPNDSESSENKTVSSSDSHETSETVKNEHSQINVLPNATKVCANSINNPTKIDNVDYNDNDDEEQRIEEEYCRQKLSEIHHAYEILRDDASRLLYHRFGIRDGPDAAVRLLTGKMMSDFEMGSSGTSVGDTSEEQCRLLELMGYPPGGYRIPSEYYQNRGHHHHHRHHHHHKHSNHNQQHGHDHHHHRHRRRHHHHNHHYHHHHQPTRQEHRIAYLASTITERLRPIVEGTVSQQLFTEELYRECRNIKRSAMGAQILRCVGRAYRVEGYRVLRKMQWEKKMIHKNAPWERGNVRNLHDSGIGNSIHSPHDVADLFRDGWRDAKHFCSAAVAAGKVMMLERRAKHLEDSYERWKAEKAQQRVSDAKNRLMQRRAGGIEDNYLDTNVQDIIGALPGEEWSDMENTDHDEDDFFFDVDSIDACFDDEDESDLFQTGVDCTDGQHDPIDHDLHRIQNKKAHDAILSAHQMEALWKITKIELDRTIRSACRWILSLTDIAVDDYDNLEEDCHRHSTYGADGWFAFCPSEQSPYYEDWQHHPREFSGSTPFPQPHDRLHRISRENYRHRQNPSRRGEYHTRGPDGWVGTNGEAIPMNVGRLRAAAALVLVGDVMVRCSKESMS